MMNVDEYQKLALRTAPKNLTRGDEMLNGLMGLNGEAGEAIDIYKKTLYMGHPFDKEHMIKELGDVCWYLALICHGMDVPMSEVLEKNITKLKARYPEGFDTDKSLNRAKGDV